MSAEDQPEVFLIQVAELGDVERIAKLADLLGYPTSTQEMQQRLKRLIAHSDHSVYVAQTPEEPVAGWIQVSISDTLVAGRQAVVNGLIVQEQYRKFGIGRSLIQHGEAWARSQGCDRIHVRSNVIRQEAHRFYEHIGYTPLKTQLMLYKALSGLSQT